MKTGMLGNSEALSQVWDGPLKDLVIKLNGESGTEVLEELKKFNRREPCWVKETGVVKVAAPIRIVPDLRQTGPPLGEWLKAREELHKFFTGETIVLRDIFTLTEEELASTMLMPVFQSAGATNRMAVKWKQRMGVKVDENEDVMDYPNCLGPERHELYLINRSARPDEDTLGNAAKSPNDLCRVSSKLWLGLYGWCDADTLHFAIMNKHLDLATGTWFLGDPLYRRDTSYRAFGYGFWGGNQVKLRFLNVNDCVYYFRDRGGRSAKWVPLRS